MCKLYLLEFDGFVKIGISTDIEKRFKHIVSMCQEKPKSQCVFEMEERADTAESYVKKFLKDFGYGVSESIKGLPVTETFTVGYGLLEGMIASRYDAKCKDPKIAFIIESIDGTRKAGRKPLPYSTKMKRIPVNLEDKINQLIEEYKKEVLS